jgi:hypothetical protein
MFAKKKQFRTELSISEIESRLKKLYTRNYKNRQNRTRIVRIAETTHSTMKFRVSIQWIYVYAVILDGVVYGNTNSKPKTVEISCGFGIIYQLMLLGILLLVMCPMLAFLYGIIANIFAFIGCIGAFLFVLRLHYWQIQDRAELIESVGTLMSY